MSGGKRPTGRKKTYGSGGGNAQRRGSGLGGKTGGPVGNSGGYSTRPKRPYSGGFGNTGSGSGDLGSGDLGNGNLGSSGFGSTGNSGFGSSGTSLGGGLLGMLLGGGGRNRSGCVSKLVMIGIVLVVIYYLFSMFKPAPADPAGSSDLFGDLINSSQGTGADNGTASGSGTGTSAFGAIGSGQTMADTTVDGGAYKVDETVSPNARDKRTVLRENGSDTVTVMVYMCGTDLESKSGMGTADLNEMLHAELSDQVRVIVETGGTSAWKNSVISSRTNQRYRVTNSGLALLEDNLGRKSMVEPETLTDFIDYCTKNYPADRNILIFWDHGGGSLAGYGYDQHFPGGAMTLDEIGEALRKANTSFDWIGFDACLMGALETAVVLEPHADYMIASEEVEPGIGWHYTGWLTALSKNPAISTPQLGKTLIDNYIQECAERTPRSQATLSLVDLAEFKALVPTTLAAFAGSMNELIDTEKFEVVSDARANAKEFSAASRLNQVDLIHFAENVGTADAKRFADSLRRTIKYNRSSQNITNANGLSAFFPNGRTSQVGQMLDTYDAIGFDDAYGRCVQTFASMAVGGQVVSTGTGSPLDALLGGLSGGGGLGTSGQTTTGSGAGTEIISSLIGSFLSSGDFSAFTGSGGSDWLDTNKLTSSASYYAENRLDASALTLTEKDGQRVLSLPEDQWELIQFMALNVFLDDGEGFIDLGLDNVYDYNADGDLIMEYDGTWVGINGQIVSYYMESDDHAGDMYTIKGRIPMLLNGELADMIVQFDNQHPEGTVLGARLRYDTTTQTLTLAKGLTDIVAGDRIDYLCDYYTYDGTYSDTYMLGQTQTATGNWEIANLRVGNMPYQMTYRITDRYGNHYWTEPVTD